MDRWMNACRHDNICGEPSWVVWRGVRGGQPVFRCYKCGDLVPGSRPPLFDFAVGGLDFELCQALRFAYPLLIRGMLFRVIGLLLLLRIFNMCVVKEHASAVVGGMLCKSDKPSIIIIIKEHASNR